ncbi:MAG: transposase [Halobacteriovoraceae bacterium]|nr:transposase [Halobacteriovoraceae bacterium]
MPRKHLIRTSEFPYHIVSRSRNKDWYDLPMDLMWEISMDSFVSTLQKFPAKVHAFVLMSNHYHLLVSTPDANIDKFMFEFNRSFSDKVRAYSKRINQIFGGRYRWSLVKDYRYLSTVYRYIYRNPIDAGLVEQVEEYSYSTLRVMDIPFIIHDLLDEPFSIQIKFFNESPYENERALIRKGMKKGIFSPPINRSNRKIEDLPRLVA